MAMRKSTSSSVVGGTSAAIGQVLQVCNGSPTFQLFYLTAKLSFGHIFQGSQIFSCQCMVGHQEIENPLGTMYDVPTAPSCSLLSSFAFSLQLLIYFKDAFESQSLWRCKFVSLRWFSDVPSTVWTLAPAELSDFVFGPRECSDRVYGHEWLSVAAKLLWQTLSPSSSSVGFYLGVRPGAVNSAVRGFFTAEHYFLSRQLRLR